MMGLDEKQMIPLPTNLSPVAAAFPTAMKAIFQRLHPVFGPEEFLLFGGAAIDLLRDPTAPVADYDIAVRNHPAKIRRCKEALVLNGFDIVVNERSYYIHRDVRVILVVAKKGDEVLDISFLDDFSDIGLFDVETLVCRFPKIVVQDPFHAVAALKRREVRLIRSLDQEDPFVVLSRFLHLCSKYDFPMHQGPEHKGLQEELLKRILQKERKSLSPSERVSPASHCSMVLRSMASAANRSMFLLDLSESDWLGFTMPELKVHLLSLGEARRPLETARGKTDLVEILINSMSPRLRTEFLQRLESFRPRVWDLEDQIIVDRLARKN